MNTEIKIYDFWNWPRYWLVVGLIYTADYLKRFAGTMSDKFYTVDYQKYHEDIGHLIVQCRVWEIGSSSFREAIETVRLDSWIKKLGYKK